MKYKVEGTMYFEGVVEIKKESETLKAFNNLIFDTDIEGLAEHIVTCNVAREMDFVEGVGNEGNSFIITENSKWFDDCEITPID